MLIVLFLLDVRLSPSHCFISLALLLFFPVVKDFWNGPTLLWVFTIIGFFNTWFEALISITRAGRGGFILKYFNDKTMSS